MKFKWANCCVLWALVALPAISEPITYVKWSEEALLHDGRSIVVVRELFETKRNFSLFGFLSLAPGQVTSLGRHKLKFNSPDTGRSIEWEGEDYFDPILLDFVDTVPYLIIVGRPTQDTAKKYGCPELPFIYLKYESGTWRSIAVDVAPANLKNANMSPGTYGISGDFRPRKEVLASISYAEQGGGQSQAQIPRTYDEWHYMYKKEYRDERRGGDCRPPRQPPTPALPKPIDISLEKLESVELPTSQTQEYVKPIFERITIKEINCVRFFAQVDPNDKLLGERFVLDQSGQKLLPYPGSPPIKTVDLFQTRTIRLCDDKYIWFVAPYEEKGKILLTKYTASGDFIYSVRISDQGSWRYDTNNTMLYGLMSSEEGVFSFYWQQKLISQQEWAAIFKDHAPDTEALVKAIPQRITKYRFKEPASQFSEPK